MMNKRETETTIPPTEYIAGDTVYRIAGAGDNEMLKALLRENEMDSWVQLSFEREPDYFAGSGLFGYSTTVIAVRQSDDSQKETVPVGMYTCDTMPLHLHGNPELVGYLGGLRVARRWRNRFNIVRRGYDSLRALQLNTGEQPFWFTSIASENRAARRLLEAGLKGMPVYKPLGDMETVIVSTHRGKAFASVEADDGNGPVFRQAIEEDLPALCEFYNRRQKHWQFSPVLSPEQFDCRTQPRSLHAEQFYLLIQDDEILACVMLWDQRHCKQTVVRGYRTSLAFMRRLYNLYASLTGRVSLPRPGKPLEQAYLAFLAVHERLSGDKELYYRFIDAALYELSERGIRNAVVGLSMANPQLTLLKTRYVAQSYRTCIEMVYWPGDLDGDTATEITEMLSGTRPPQPEVAVL